MKKIFTYCFDDWWKPILFWVVSFGLVVISDIIKISDFGYVSYGLLAIALIGLIVSGIYQLIKKRWFKAIFTGLFFGGTIVAFVLYGIFMFFIETVDGDGWADNLTIPENIELYLPKGDGFQIRPDSINDLTKNKLDFELYNSFQPGLYEYDLWVNKIEKGTVYLKAFEITQEYPLSTDRLLKQSSIKINNPTDSILKFGTNGHFTIYEGDWGKPYAAGFEIWFKPDNSGKERKLIDKVYKIEGWMR